MPIVRITGWHHGLRKVSMTRAIHLASGLGLAAAKACTDRVLDGGTATVLVPDAEAAARLVDDLRALGAEANLDPDTDA